MKRGITMKKSEKKDSMLNIRIPLEDKEKIISWAKFKNISTSAFVLEMIKKMIESKENIGYTDSNTANKILSHNLVNIYNTVNKLNNKAKSNKDLSETLDKLTNQLIEINANIVHSFYGKKGEKS